MLAGSRAQPHRADRGVRMRVRALCLFLILVSSAAQSQRPFRVVHAFGNGKDGVGVYGSVVLDNAGNIYGTTFGGGIYSGGTVFLLRTGTKGHWSEVILHNFGHGNDGVAPLDGPTLGSSGDLYGTTESGVEGGVYGTVFKLSPASNAWKETVLHRFGQHDQDGSPWGSVIIGRKGNVYGTAASAAFELTPGPKGWKETILHNFTGENGDGAAPFAGPIRDAVGNLYGTTMHGGGGGCGAGCGTAWELSPPVDTQRSGGQGWTEHILHAFGVGDDLAFPGLGQLAMDRQGNLYGTTVTSNQWGAVYKLTRVSGGREQSETWQESILYNFSGGDGAGPEGVILDKAGNLYGICGGGGQYGEGVVFKLSPQRNGTWKYTPLHTFTGHDGAQPEANLTFGPDGKLYGTASIGGAYGGGVVFQLTP
jgi:uncharacterized repeat protein (TIGR03803 family)